MSRQDVIIVASVSAIYGLGDPDAYRASVLHIPKGKIYRRNALLRQLVDIQYQRNDLEVKPGIFRVRGDTLEILPAYSEREAYRINFFGDEIEEITRLNPLTGEVLEKLDEVNIYPAKHYITEDKRMEKTLMDIEAELVERGVFPQRRPPVGSTAAGTAHAFRPRNAARGWLVRRHRKLLPSIDQRAAGTPP